MTYTIELDSDITTSTLLDDLNGGAGVVKGTIEIVDTAGQEAVLDLSVGDIQTVGDVIDAINRLSVGVYARINDTGDGILIQDLEHGEGTLRIIEGIQPTSVAMTRGPASKAASMASTCMRLYFVLMKSPPPAMMSEIMRPASDGLPARYWNRAAMKSGLISSSGMGPNVRR